MATKKLQILGNLGGTINLDATLTQEGMAADAKATGDAIASALNNLGNGNNIPEAIIKVTIFDSALNVKESDGVFYVLENVALTVGEEYTISINGQDFNATAVSTEVNGVSVTYLGNAALYSPNDFENTGESYLFGIAPDLFVGDLQGVYYGMFVTSDAEISVAESVYLKLEYESNKHLMLVTDSDGKTTWEERTHYHEHSESTEEILPKTTAADVEGELYITGTPFVLEVGSTYEVTYNGAVYKCVAFQLEGGICLGNGKAVDESLPGNDEPFILMSTQGDDLSGGAFEGGAYGMVLPLDEADDCTISITKSAVIDKLKKIPKKFLPEEKFGVIEEEIIFLPETTVSQSDGLGYGMTAFEKIPEIGQGFIATYDGVDYECIALKSTNEAFAVVFGHSSAIGGDNNPKIPFGIGVFSESDSAYAQGYRFMFTTTDSNEHTLKVHMPVGYVQRINLKCMPMSVSPTWNIVSNIYEASVSGDDIPDTAKYYSALTSAEIVDAIKTGRLGIGQFFYSYVYDETSGAMSNIICPITDMAVGSSSSGTIIVRMHATINSTTVAYIEWRDSTNNYSVEIQDAST